MQYVKRGIAYITDNSTQAFLTKDDQFLINSLRVYSRFGGVWKIGNHKAKIEISKLQNWRELSLS